MLGDIIQLGDKAFEPNGNDVSDMNPDEINAYNARLEAERLVWWDSQPNTAIGYIVPLEEKVSIYCPYMLIDGYSYRPWHKLVTFQGAFLGYAIRTGAWNQWSPRGWLTKMTAWRIFGSNGRVYYGRHGDMDLIRLRACKDAWCAKQSLVG